VWRGRVGRMADLLGQAPPQEANSSSSGQC
jgi:hypothetical protein